MRRREYSGPVQLRAMQSLAVRVFPTTGYRHIGDLAWNACLCPDRADESPTAVWTEGDRTLAWGWLESPKELMLQADPSHPGHPELVDDVLAWAERTADGPLSVDVAETEPHLVDALERRGYARAAADAPFMACLGRPLTGLPDIPPLPEGYTIRAQQGRDDVAGRAAAHRAAFGSTRVTTERHARMRETWPYRPGLDLVVASPAGEIVAYCQGWYDEANGIGVFEPVGTHPGHRRLGLARAVSTAVLHAFADAGGHRAVVYSRGDAGYPVPKLVYESLDFRTYTRTHTYLGQRGA
ncbi:GNAT family N-acetyltransferase [Streptomyces sp. NBC_01142]|uniref:GNAT family N-acetyltransferase n=1 Tax=Streptomyces sp. NBC_01142 TaxID=2975865 RepID=UPI002259E72E|nr:GNAT family N-acetyltransferase [Streptomyces sp. NBC_01142]MCX4825352.1 GNAT family N-acetyltransferase [Streptomyces sp. NBC_01142]